MLYFDSPIVTTVSVAAGKGKGACAPGRQQRGEAPKVGEIIFGDTKYAKNSVNSVEAGMGMEGQIMCIEKCTF